MPCEFSAGQSGNHFVRRACTQDAAALYALKVEAFGHNSLLYTIYQAPKAVHYLKHLITDAIQGQGQDFFVLEYDGRIDGYYHAVRNEHGYFLNYIAVANRAKRSGLGGILLHHFEETGKAIGYKRFMLDVFDSNRAVYEWYYRQGYSFDVASFHVRLSISDLADDGATLLKCDKTAWAGALETEQFWGFSKVNCICASGQITIGLIDGRICKLLAYTGISQRQAVSAIARHFKGERRTLIISNLPFLPSDWPILSSEKALRLVKVTDDYCYHS